MIILINFLLIETKKQVCIMAHLECIRAKGFLVFPNEKIFGLVSGSNKNFLLAGTNCSINFNLGKQNHIFFSFGKQILVYFYL